MTARRIVVDLDQCTGHGRCYSLAPQLVDADDNGSPIPLQEVVESPDDLAAAQKIVASCPEQAISLRPA